MIRFYVNSWGRVIAWDDKDGPSPQEPIRPVTQSVHSLLRAGIPHAIVHGHDTIETLEMHGLTS